ncbi:MAG: glycosyltransferase family 2 protein [Chloroflexota bacterium]|nr:glycosyltransferase family 2 protein [Chloroflexota bacterium]
MSVIITLFQILLLGAEVALALMISYLLLLTGAAVFAPRHTKLRQQSPSQRFLILVPAHNEERLLPSLLDNLRQLDYPASLYAIHVIADNCTDQTAGLARANGAIAHERVDDERRGKGYALQWLMQQLEASAAPHDAVLILDADSIISPNFLTVMDARLARGERAIQAYYAVRDPQSSWSASLRSVALAALHYLRPLGRMPLGGSAGLKGNGMVFAAEILREYQWTASLTEDIEYHMALILGGHRVTFAPDAIVWAEMPSSLQAARTQNVRWERGRQEMLRQYVPRLLRAALARRSFLLFDAAVEQIIPPFSLVAAASVLSLVAAVALQSMPAVLLGVFLLLGQAVYILTGLWLSGAPKKVYQALLYAPIFIVWKVWLYLRVLIGLDRKDWTRTARNDT